jgi:hypothetical protein
MESSVVYVIKDSKRQEELALMKMNAKDLMFASWTPTQNV